MKVHKNTNDERIAVLETNVNHTQETLLRIERTIETMNIKMDEGFKSVNSRIWTNFYWTLAAITALGAVMAHGFKWF